MANLLEGQTDPISPGLAPAISSPNAADYRAAHRNRLMVLTKLKDATPSRDEFCHICGVETLAPGLWITANFLDGSTKRFRPEKIRVATEGERLLSTELAPV